MKKRVMVILAEGFEEGETTTILDVLRRAGFEADGVSLTGELVTGAHGMRLAADRILSGNADAFKDYDMIVLPGGWGAADNMAASEELRELLRWYNAEPDRYVAAMCAAPGVLAKAGITTGKTVTSYPGPKLEPLFADAHYVTDTVAFDDHLITSRGPATALPFAFALVDQLGGDSAYIKERFLYRALKEYPDAQ